MKYWLEDCGQRQSLRLANSWRRFSEGRQVLLCCGWGRTMNVILEWRMNGRCSCVKKFLEGVVVVTSFSVSLCLFLCQELSISMMKTTLQPSSNQSSLDAPLLSFRFPHSTHESYPGPHYYRSPTVLSPYYSSHRTTKILSHVATIP